RLHRDVLQSPPTPLQPRLPQPGGVRGQGQSGLTLCPPNRGKIRWRCKNQGGLMMELGLAIQSWPSRHWSALQPCWQEALPDGGYGEELLFPLSSSPSPARGGGSKS